MGIPQAGQSSTGKAGGTESVQDLLAAGKDPFINDSEPAAMPEPQSTAATTPRVLDLAAVTIPEPAKVVEPEVAPELEPHPDPATQLAEFDQTESSPEQEDGPRPFVDAAFQMTAADQSAAQDSEVMTAVDQQTTENVGVEADLPRPFIFAESEEVAESTSTDNETEVTSEEIYVFNEDLKNAFIEEGATEEPEVEISEVAQSTEVAEPEIDQETVEAADVEQVAMEQDSAELEEPVADLVMQPPQFDEAVVETSAKEVHVPVEDAKTDSIVFDNGPRQEEPRQEVSTEFCPAPVAGPAMAAPQHPAAMAPPYSQSNVYPAPETPGDEYIHDGGDAGTKVYYSDYARFGLDVEDTIAEYDDDVGVAHVKATTRATIYAPKFAAVRSATLPYTDVKVVKLAGHQDQRTLAGIDTKLVVDEKTHNDEALGIRLRTRPSGVEGMAADTSVHQNQSAQRHVKLLNAYEEIRFFREGQLARLNIAVVGDSIAAALDWNGDLGVNIYANDQAGQAVQGRFTAQDYTGVEDRRSPGDLSIVKVVDKKVAKPGEVLTFTIRFENTGDRPLRNIRIVDNLSPRLTYVESSVDSDLDGKLDTEDNGRGSQILNFTFDTELKGHTGGWVSFKCKVR